MSAADFSKIPITVVDVVLDFCTLRHSVGDCTATRSATGGQCFNTFETCQAKSVYVKGSKTYRFVSPNLPNLHGLTAYRCLRSVKRSPGYINIIEGTPATDRISIECDDFVDDDNHADPYRAGRRALGSTFFRRLRKRNPQYQNRTVYIRTGYVDPSRIFDVDELTTQRYTLSAFSTPSDSGVVKFEAVDILAPLEDVMLPRPTSAQLAAAMTDSATSATLEGNYSTLPESDFLLIIDDEIMLVGTRTADALSSITRGQGGTTAAEHDDETRVQEVWSPSEDTPAGIWAEIQTDAGIDAALVDSTGAATETARLLTGWTGLTTYYTEPTKAKEILQSLCQTCGMFTWWDPIEQKTKLSTLRPKDPTELAGTITARAHIISEANPIKVKEDERITQVVIYYGVKDYSKDISKYDEEKPNFSRVSADINATAQSANSYGDVRPMEIFAHWLPASFSQAEVQSAAWRRLERYLNPPEVLKFDLEAATADDLDLGATPVIEAPELIDYHGIEQQREMVVTRKVPPAVGSTRSSFEAETTGYDDGKWWIWAPDDIATGDYTAAERDLYAQYADADGTINGQPGFKYI